MKRRADEWLPIAAVWLGLGAVLAALSAQVVDWYVMTDELLYERLAISVGQTHSPLPHIHGELIGNVNQLYPLLLAPLFDGRLVPDALRDAHILNGFVMSSACIPVYLLARRVLVSRASSLAVAALSVVVPWIVLSSFLMTEVVAYPVFAWAMLALYAAMARPSRQLDLLLLLALAVAIFARTQFAVLVAVVPVALFLHLPSPRRLVAEHRALAVAYGLLVVAAVALAAAGELTHVLGTYSVTAEGNIAPSGMPRSLLEHLAPLGLGLCIVPFILGVAWLLVAVIRRGPAEQHVFASMAVVTFVALLFEVTSYDLRFGAERLHDRYLFYVVPLLLVAAAAMLRERRWPWWSLAAAGSLLAFAFTVLTVTSYGKFNVDSPVALLNEPLLDLGGSERGARLLLALLAIVATTLLLTPRRVALVAVSLAVLGIPALGGAAFTRLLAHDGTSGRPITLEQGVVFNWVDRQLGSGANVTMIPYPILYGTYWENVAYWWNVEFWNASVRRSAEYEHAFTGTPETFPTTQIAFDRQTGRASASPTRYVVAGVAETRFRLAGRALGDDRGAVLLDTAQPWRADWLSFGLYRDGWTIPNKTATVRIFATPNQTATERRYVTISIRAPRDQEPRPVVIRSNDAEWQADVSQTGASTQVSACVPRGGYADVRVRAPRYSPIYGDPRSEQSFVSYARSGGVLVTGIALADETGSC